MVLITYKTIWLEYRRRVSEDKRYDLTFLDQVDR
jgi:hypothetical protein